jgi:hypothetical protein
MLLLAAACGANPTSPAPSKPLQEGGGLMGSGTVVPPPPADTTGK